MTKTSGRLCQVTFYTCSKHNMCQYIENNDAVTFTIVILNIAVTSASFCPLSQRGRAGLNRVSFMQFKSIESRFNASFYTLRRFCSPSVKYTPINEKRHFNEIRSNFTSIFWGGVNFACQSFLLAYYTNCRLQRVAGCGLKVMSIGFLIDFLRRHQY
jgi:hypothetical protein